MIIKVLGGLVAVSLVLAYLLPFIFKLKEVSLGAVIVIGLIMMLVDLWDSFQKEE